MTEVTRRRTNTQKVLTNPDTVNRSQEELIATQINAHKQQGNAIQSGQIVQLEDIIAALQDGMSIRIDW